MNASEDIFRAYDIRGVYGDELDANIGERVGLAFGNFLKKKHSSGKMSTRAGRVVYLDDMMEKIVTASFERLKEVDMSPKQKKILSEKIGIGSLRYNILKVQPEKGFTFNIEDALSIQGDSAPFAMYSHARMCSIIKKHGKNIPEMKVDADLIDSEIELIRIMAKWPQIIELSSDKLAIHNIPNYIHQLSSQFNNFYRDCKVIGDVNESFRINLVFSVKRILFDALDIIGIEAPERM